MICMVLIVSGHLCIGKSSNKYFFIRVKSLQFSLAADAYMKNREILFFEKRTYPQSLLFFLLSTGF